MIDECGRIRHFFANLALCKHKVRIEKSETKGELGKLFHDSFHDELIDISDDQNLPVELTTEEHLKAVLASWNLIHKYRVPFCSIMGVEKWTEVSEVFFAAVWFLDEEEEK